MESILGLLVFDCLLTVWSHKINSDSEREFNVVDKKFAEMSYENERIYSFIQ